MNERIWIPLCLIFGLYHLSLLVDDYYLTNYLIVEPEDDLYDDKTFFFFCTPFEQIKENNRLKEIPVQLKNVSGKIFQNYSITSILNRLGLEGHKILDPERCFSYNQRICFMVTQSELETEWLFFEKFLKYYKFLLYASSRYAIQSLDSNVILFCSNPCLTRNFSPPTVSGRHPFIYQYAYYQNPNQKQNKFYLKIQKQKVYGKQYLLKPKCFKFEDQFASSKFNCLNKCFMEFEFGLALDYSKDTKKFDLNEVVNHRNVGELPEIGRKNIDYCLKRCRNIEDCFQETYNVINLGEAYAEAYSKADQIKIDLQSRIYRAYFSTTDFYLQFFGLLTRKKFLLRSSYQELLLNGSGL